MKCEDTMLRASECSLEEAIIDPGFELYDEPIVEDTGDPFTERVWYGPKIFTEIVY